VTGPSVAAGPSVAWRPVITVRPRLAGTRLALAVLLAGMLALVGRHLAPAFRVLLEALALLGRHGLVLAIPLEDLLLLLWRQPLESVVRGLELALPVIWQRLPALKILLEAGAVGGRHAAEPLLILPRDLPLVGRETLPVTVVLRRCLPLLGRHLPPLLEIALSLCALFRRQALEPADGSIAGRARTG
jgi:hypothetical protein